MISINQYLYETGYPPPPQRSGPGLGKIALGAAGGIGLAAAGKYAWDKAGGWNGIKNQLGINGQTTLGQNNNTAQGNQTAPTNNGQGPHLQNSTTPQNPYEIRNVMMGDPSKVTQRGIIDYANEQSRAVGHDSVWERQRTDSWWNPFSDKKYETDEEMAKRLLPHYTDAYNKSLMPNQPVLAQPNGQNGTQPTQTGQPQGQTQNNAAPAPTRNQGQPAAPQTTNNTPPVNPGVYRPDNLPQQHAAFGPQRYTVEVPGRIPSANPSGALDMAGQVRKNMEDLNPFKESVQDFKIGNLYKIFGNGY